MSVKPILELRVDFLFESAHRMPHFPEGHPNNRIHGHSYYGSVTLEGIPNPDTGFILEESEVKLLIEPVVKKLDHNYLNDIPGLGAPTSENIAVWLWNEWKNILPGLKSIEVKRPSVGMSVKFSGKYSS